MGLEFNPRKQLSGPYAEFLRIWYTHSSISGFSMRALAGIAVEKCTRDQLFDPIMNVRSLLKNVHVFNRRGGGPTVCKIFHKFFRTRYCLVKQGASDNKPVRIPQAIMNQPIEKNGIGIYEPGTVLIHNTDIDRPPLCV
jgi:hypothetical protein